MKAIGLLTTIMLLVGQAVTADAATVTPKGKYAFTSFNNCESHFEFKFGTYQTSDPADTLGDAVRILSVVDNGHLGSGVGHLTFKPTHVPTFGSVAMSGGEIGGGALRISDATNKRHFGVDVTTDPQRFLGTYTVATNTLTITPGPDGPAMTYMVAYGALDAAGTPVSIHLVRRYVSGDNKNCVEAITATR